MRLVFMGTPQAAVPSLRALASSRHRVVGVVCQPDRPASRGRHVAAPPVKQAAQELGLPVLQPETLKTAEFRAEIEALGADAFVVVAYGRLLGPRLLALARHGALNLHFSLLPRWRGAAPVQRAILAGDEVAGVAIIRLVAELDAGPVIAEQAVAIEPEEHAPSLEARLARIGADLLVATLDAVDEGRATEREQDAAGVTLAPPLQKDEGRLDPSGSAEALARKVRAFDPWPGARLLLPRGGVAVIDAVALDETSDAPAGTILPPRGEALPMACGSGVLLLRQVKPEGRGPMTGKSLINGRFTQAGEVAVMPPGTAESARPSGPA